MRLSDALAQQITKNIKDVFGDVDIYLFGSRTDDLKRGGDIDIAINSSLSSNEFKKAKIALEVQLMLHSLNELPLDITQLKSADGVFYDEIQRTKVKLG